MRQHVPGWSAGPDVLESYRVFTRSSKRPANFQQMYSKYARITGRLLDRVNTPLDLLRAPRHFTTMTYYRWSGMSSIALAHAYAWFPPEQRKKIDTAS